MQLRVVRRVPIGDVSQRVTELKTKYGGSLEGVPDLFAGGRVGREAMDDYVEWLGMEQALRAYGEGEDFDYFTEEVLEFGWDKISRLTPRRLELLDKLSRHRVSSINDLASKIGRNVKNVYNDLKTLEGLGFVALVREERRSVPELLVKEVAILLW